MSEELKPCPLCGSPAEYSYECLIGDAYAEGGEEHAISCKNDECRLYLWDALTKEELFKKWNTRL